MKLTIDTKEDSAEHIKHVIAMLRGIVGEGALSNMPEHGSSPISEPQPGYSPHATGFISLFGNDSAEQSYDAQRASGSSDESTTEEPVKAEEGFTPIFADENDELVPEQSKEASSLDVDPAKIQRILQKAALEKAKAAEKEEKNDSKKFRVEEYL